jgi:ABC-type sugar transport system ATPase subunit
MENREILRLNNISKTFFNVYAVRDISFSVNEGEILSLIGENGAGKSTLMNIIGGMFPPDNGEMYWQGEPYVPQIALDAANRGIAFIHQELNLFNNLSVLDNIHISNFETGPLPVIRRRKLREKVTALLESVDLNISPDMAVERLSPGERQLVEIAKALSENPRLIIFDEPTTSLTTKETQKLFLLIKKLREQGIAIIYISHILADVEELSDRIVVLRDGSVTDAGKKETFTINRMIASMVGRDIKQMYPEQKPAAEETALLEVKNLSQPRIVHNINFHVKAGEIVGIFGLMGSGRSELAQIIFGLEPFNEGQIFFQGSLMDRQDPITRIRGGCAYVTENRREEGLFMDFSVYENIRLTALRKYRNGAGIIDSRRLEEPVQKAISGLRIKSSDIRKHQVKGLSGGNQQKVVLAKWLLTNPSMMIIDEPTRGIDVGAKAEIYGILNELARNGTGILVISSELEEITGICGRILVMSRGEIVAEFDQDHFNREDIIRAAFRQNLETKHGNTGREAV